MELRDRTILVTGCAGFIASHLAEELLRRGNRVVGIDNLSAGRREFMSGMLSDPGFRFIEGDLLTMDLSGPLKGVDVLCHFAANPDVRLGATDTRVHFDQNITVTYRLLEAGRKSGLKDILFPSTSTVYGETDVIPTPEDYGPLLPISVYGASKLACEALIASYCHSFEQNAVLYRFANVVGTRSTHNVLHDFIRKLREDPTSLEILGAEPGTSKSYVHVSDCVQGMIVGAEAAREQVEVFNIGSRDWMTVKDIADIVTEEMGLTPEYRWTGGVMGGRGWIGDVRKMLLSVDKLTSAGWTPRMGSREAIRRAVQEILA
ncbi:MAG TPA: NAD-dependent epimerase/dehydratase family protein [Methanomassiliicoccaceae archaeon]|jgi:UDP-glucose 4-epimerase|nr:NAD-dependent epimerase/dehydratase family protein [Euryarchaeota archaeon]HOB39201.1 NAD-dependent epimerase/dehydratase family protein [Methanomassiliicoccaceae archaeon]HOK27540.1 NAD-dependent epimerase/dehydratase family protein [Methanomassiliicoccaceae archaeon]HOQ26272.1 NAD-dependent epimerase/dehydratase family protein [Methanomassiliicoccaceae archaeon]HPP45074.1 NAD-dependent epimerase/dehydratase family protein [Methanomassiliicoccaceae archaeon]